MRLKARSTQAVVLGGALAALAIAGVALGGELKRNSRTVAVPNDGQAHFASVDCAPRTKATGGGGETTESGHQDASYPSGGREWTASALGGLPGEELSVHVICLKKGHGKLKQASASAPPTKDLGGTTGTLARATATCPAGTKVIGGGIEVEPEDAVAVSSFPSSKRAWSAGAVFFVESEEGVTAHAVCVKDRKVKRRSENARLANDGQVHATTVRCPKGTKAAGGGFAIGDPAESSGRGSFPSSKRKWTARANMLSSGDDTELTAHVLCLKKRKKK